MIYHPPHLCQPVGLLYTIPAGAPTKCLPDDGCASGVGQPGIDLKLYVTSVLYNIIL
jgi:hypothetical protein